MKKSKKVNVCVTLDESDVDLLSAEYVRRITKNGAKSGVSISQIVRDAVRSLLGRSGESSGEDGDA